MSLFRKILLLLVIIGGLNWGIYGIWGFDAVGWLLGGSLGWLARAVFIVVGAGSHRADPLAVHVRPPRKPGAQRPVTRGAPRRAPPALRRTRRTHRGALAMLRRQRSRGIPVRSRQKSPAPTQPAGRHARGAQQQKARLRQLQCRGRAFAVGTPFWTVAYSPYASRFPNGVLNPIARYMGRSQSAHPTVREAAPLCAYAKVTSLRAMPLWRYAGRI